jgi:hypothetical protein
MRRRRRASPSASSSWSRLCVTPRIGWQTVESSPWMPSSGMPSSRRSMLLRFGVRGSNACFGSRPFSIPKRDRPAADREAPTKACCQTVPLWAVRARSFLDPPRATSATGVFVANLRRRLGANGRRIFYDCRGRGSARRGAGTRRQGHAAPSNTTAGARTPRGSIRLAKAWHRSRTLARCPRANVAGRRSRGGTCARRPCQGRRRCILLSAFRLHAVPDRPSPPLYVDQVNA